MNKLLLIFALLFLGCHEQPRPIQKFKDGQTVKYVVGNKRIEAEILYYTDWMDLYRIKYVDRLGIVHKLNVDTKELE